MPFVQYNVVCDAVSKGRRYTQGHSYTAMFGTSLVGNLFYPLVHKGRATPLVMDQALTLTDLGAWREPEL